MVRALRLILTEYTKCGLTANIDEIHQMWPYGRIDQNTALLEALRQNRPKHGILGALRLSNAEYSPDEALRLSNAKYSPDEALRRNRH